MTTRIEAHAGDYDKRVKVYRNVATENPDGQKVETPELFCRPWAKTVPVGGTERPLDQQLQADVTHLVRMHSDSRSRQITPKMWLILADGTRLNIKRAVDVEGRGIEVELECNERI